MAFFEFAHEWKRTVKSLEAKDQLHFARFSLILFIMFNRYLCRLRCIHTYLGRVEEALNTKFVTVLDNLQTDKCYHFLWHGFWLMYVLELIRIYLAKNRKHLDNTKWYLKFTILNLSTVQVNILLWSTFMIKKIM